MTLLTMLPASAGFKWHDMPNSPAQLQQPVLHPLELRPALLLGPTCPRAHRPQRPCSWCLRRALWPASSYQLLLCGVASLQVETLSPRWLPADSRPLAVPWRRGGLDGDEPSHLPGVILCVNTHVQIRRIRLSQRM